MAELRGAVLTEIPHGLASVSGRAEVAVPLVGDERSSSRQGPGSSPALGSQLHNRHWEPLQGGWPRPRRGLASPAGTRSPAALPSSSCTKQN